MIPEATKEKLHLEDFFQNNQQNIVPLLSEERVNDIYIAVTKKLGEDQESRQDKINKLQDYIKLALLTTEEKSYPFEGAANAMIPLVANAVIQFGATAFPPLVQDDQLVKFKVIGSDDGKIQMQDGKPILDEETGEPKKQFVGFKAARGRRMTTYMNYQINEEMPWYKRDLYQYLMCCAAIGTVYRKIYRDPINKRQVSKFVMPDKLIVNENIVSLQDGVITEILDLSPTQVMENIRKGLFVDYEFDWEKQPTLTLPLTQESINPSKEENDIVKRDFRFIAQYSFLDLDDDGFPEPYIITCDLDKTKVVRIVPDFYPENIEYNEQNQVCRIKREQTFVDYILIPSADGGHLGVGFGHLLYNLNKVANGTINQLLDAGHLSIKGGGFIGKNMNIRGGRFAMGLGEWKMVDNFGANIRDSIVPLPTPEISPALIQLLTFLIESGKETGSLRDVLTGDTAANMAPTTYMGIVEQGLKQFLAIFKGWHDSDKISYKLLRRLNARYTTDEEYARVLDEPENNVSAQADFSAEDCDIVPVADPASVTSSQKMAQAQIIQSLFTDPFYDEIKIRKMWNNAVQIPGLDDALRRPNPQPDPNMVFAEAENKKADAKMMELQLKAGELDEKSVERQYKNADTIAGIKVKESQTIKNMADAEATVAAVEIDHKNHTLDVVKSASEAMTKKIEAEAKADALRTEAEAKTEAETLKAAQPAESD